MPDLLWILILVLVLVVAFGAPTWGYHQYGWYPSGGIGAVVVVLIIVWLVLGRV